MLISADYVCKISDFGMSREVGDDKEYYRSSSKIVPVRWTAIEALEDQRFSEASDVWAFGIVMYEIFTSGQSPYTGMSNNEVWVKVKDGYRLPCPASCPEDFFKEVVSACWMQDAKQRPAFGALVPLLKKRAPERKAGALEATQDVPTIASSNFVVSQASPLAQRRRPNNNNKQHADVGVTDQVEQRADERGSYVALEGADGKVIDPMTSFRLKSEALHHGARENNYQSSPKVPPRSPRPRHLVRVAPGCSNPEAAAPSASGTDDVASALSTTTTATSMEELDVESAKDSQAGEYLEPMTQNFVAISSL